MTTHKQSNGSNLLHFNFYIGRNKPESIINRSTKCPFCHPEELDQIIDTDGSIILVKNKYPVIQDSFQTVLIEHESCDEHLATYPKDHLHRLFRFGLKHWERMLQSGEYRSVMFYKNHGPFSGGSIHHSHMQIVGLNHVDCQEHIEKKHFAGLLVDEKPGVMVTVSTQPIMGFFEFNIVLLDRNCVEQMAEYIQVITRYMLTDFHSRCTSYNLFIYRIGEEILVKIVPRFVTSPIFVGYKIPQLANNIEEKAEELRKLIHA